MERLTYFENGEWRIKLYGVVYSAPAIDKLAAYENTCFTPSDIKDMRNELCLLCGKYKQAHNGACDGCRCRKEET